MVEPILSKTRSKKFIVIDSTTIRICRKNHWHKEKEYDIKRISFTSLNRLEKELTDRKYQSGAEFIDGEVRGFWIEWEKL